MPFLAFSQGNAPKALSIQSAFGPKTEMAMFLDLDGIQKSGFVKKVEAEFPELMQAFDEGNGSVFYRMWGRLDQYSQ